MIISCDVLCIDEISMVSRKLFETVEEVSALFTFQKYGGPDSTWCKYICNSEWKPTTINTIVFYNTFIAITYLPKSL